MFELKDLKVGMKLQGKKFGGIVTIVVLDNNQVKLTKAGSSTISSWFTLSWLSSNYKLIDEDFKPLINPHITKQHTCVFKKEKWFSGKVFEYCLCGKLKS